MTGTNKGSFNIKIISQQNGTWQGVIINAATLEAKAFRSLLELIKLIDSTFENNEEGR